MAAVRDPRPLGWNLLALLGLLLLAALAGVLIAAWLTRRREGWSPWQRPLPEPPHLALAAELRALEEAELPARGEARRHLHRLAAALHRYAAVRFRLPAGDVAAATIGAAAARRGFPATSVGDLAALLAELDRRRFAPAPVAPDVCRQLTVRAFALVDGQRPRHLLTPVPAARRVAAERDWAWLAARLDPRGAVTRAEPTGAAGGER
jgi:hypothetical protein